jgi:hypothetical protein
MHWGSGYTAYFPTYTLGAMYAAQIWTYAQSQIAGLDEQVARGEFGPLRELLKVKIHASESSCLLATFGCHTRTRSHKHAVTGITDDGKLADWCKMLRGTAGRCVAW